MQQVDAEPTTLADQLEVGDRVIVYEKSGRVIDMTVTSIDENTLRGAFTRNPLTGVEIQVENIAKIEVEEIDGGMTALAVVGGTLAVVTVIPLLLIGAAMSGS
jgi:hypothetical protein